MIESFMKIPRYSFKLTPHRIEFGPSILHDPEPGPIEDSFKSVPQFQIQINQAP